MLIILPLIAIAIVGGAFIAYAYTTWNQTVTWNIAEDTNFSVWSDLTTGSEILPSTILSLGSNPSNPTIIIYYIQNDGNVPIEVMGVVTFQTGSATDSWTPGSGIVDVYSGGVRVPLTLTLVGLSGGSGSITVSFTSIAKP